MRIGGRVWSLADRTSVFDILPARYDDLGVNARWDECAAHLLEDVDPAFAADVRAGDVIVGGADLGSGHSHFYRATIAACQAAGVAALFGESTSELFQRAAIDQGLAVWAYPGITALVGPGDVLDLDLASGEATNRTTGQQARFRPLDPLITEIIAASGAFKWAKRKALARTAGATPG